MASGQGEHCSRARLQSILLSTDASSSSICHMYFVLDCCQGEINDVQMLLFITLLLLNPNVDLLTSSVINWPLSGLWFHMRAGTFPFPAAPSSPSSPDLFSVFCRHLWAESHHIIAGLFKAKTKKSSIFHDIHVSCHPSPWTLWSDRKQSEGVQCTLHSRSP